MNLARPGGNITGFANFEPAIGGKWLQTLKEMAPHLTRIAVVRNPAALLRIRQSIETEAASMGMEVVDKVYSAYGERPGSPRVDH